MIKLRLNDYIIRNVSKYEGLFEEIQKPEIFTIMGFTKENRYKIIKYC